MISQKIQKALQGSSAIRAMFVEGNELAARVGRENVYDFSLGNPATPAPAALNEAIKQLVDETDPLVLHGYMDNAGYPDVRQAVAENLNKRFGTAFTSHNIVMTVGAAGGLNIIFKTILDPGDEVIVPMKGDDQEKVPEGAKCYDWFFCTKPLPKEEIGRKLGEKV